MNQCVYTKEYFETADGEHILQNFLGARWTSKKISSNQVQKQFGNTIDLALANGLKEIRNILGTRSGRGDPGPPLKNVFSSGGTRFTVDPGGKPNIAEPIIKTVEMSDGRHQFEVVLGKEEQLGWAVAKLKEKYPGVTFDIDQLHHQAVNKSGYPDDTLKYEMTLGGNEFFRGALKAAFNLLGASDAKIALLDLFDGVRKFILNGSGDSKKFVRWLKTTEAIEIPKIGDFDQFVAVYSKDGYVDGYIQFYGELGFLLRLADRYEGPDFCYGYVVDSFRKKDPAEIRHPDFSKEGIPTFDSGSLHQDEVVRSVMNVRLPRIIERYNRRIDEQNLSSIVDDVLPPPDGQTITKAMYDELLQKAEEYIVHRVSRGCQNNETE